MGADSQPHIDGINSGTQLNSRNQSVGGIGQVQDEASIAEMVYDTGSGGAEFAQSGVRTNLIPKAGSNTFSGELFLDGGHENFADSNLTPELEEQGFAFAPTAYNWSVNPAVRRADHPGTSSGSSARMSRPGTRPSSPISSGTRTSHQRRTVSATTCARSTRATAVCRMFASPTRVNDVQKVMSAWTQHQNNFSSTVGTGFGRVAPEALFGGNADPTYMSTTRWTAPFTDRLLVEATFSYQRMNLQFTDFEEERWSGG